MEKKIIFGTLAGAVTSFLLGGLVYGLLLKDVMAEWMKGMESCVHEQPPMLPIALASLVMSLLVSILLHRNAVATFRGGAMFAAWFFLLIYVWFDLWMFASFKAMTIKLMLYDMIGNALIGAVTGGVIGWLFGKLK